MELRSLIPPRPPRLAEIPYLLLFVVLVAAVATFVVRDFHSSVAGEVETIERDAGLVAELVTVPLTSADFRLLAAVRAGTRATVGGAVSSWSTPQGAFSTRPAGPPRGLPAGLSVVATASSVFRAAKRGSRSASLSMESPGRCS